MALPGVHTVVGGGGSSIEYLVLDPL
jgi:hypothetical protein